MNKRRMNWLESMRVDRSHLRSLEDSAIFDFKALLQGFVAGQPYILKGFNIFNPGSFIGNSAPSLQVVVADSIVWHPSQAEGSFLTVPAGEPNEILASSNPKVSGSFTANSVNYISIEFERKPDPTTADLVAFWDVNSKVEFDKTVPLGLILNYKFVINTIGFGTNIPLAIVTTDNANNVVKIENAKNGLFRLGKGGTNPNPNYSWTYSLATENPLSVSSSGGPSPFEGGDWEITSFKEWADAVMSEIKAMKGSSYWYSPGSSSLSNVNLLDTWFDSVGSVVTGVGKFVHSDTVPGQLEWTSNINIRSIIGPLMYTIPAGNVTLSNPGDVAYILLQRNVDFQPANVFTFTNGSPTVTATAAITGIAPGDWIKFHGHDIGKWARVSTVSGTTITLTSPYTGANATGKALKSVSTYNVLVSAPGSIPPNSDVFWIAKRDDSPIATATIQPAASSGATRLNDIATITTTAPHGLVAGQTVAISGVDNPTFNGVAEIIDVPTPTTFTYLNPGANVGPGAAGSGTVTTRTKIFLRYVGELVQGEERQIDDNAVLNVLNFIGSESETDTTPPYTNYPNALSPYTFSNTSNLTQAISAITGNVNSILNVLENPSYDETIEIVSGGTPVVQASQATGGSGIQITASAERIGQSFTAIASNFLTSVTLSLRRVGLPDANIICEIYTNSSGSPGTLIATSTNSIPASSLTGTYTTYTFNLPPTPVDSGVIYWVVLRAVSVITLTASDYVEAEDNTSNPYAGGTESFFNGINWTPNPTNDLVFTVNSLTLPTNQWPPIPAGSVITIPKNTRVSGTPQQNYVVGKGALELYLNGQYLRLGATNGWQEVGAPLTNSTQVIINQNLVPGDELVFRLDANGGPGTGGAAPDDNFVTLPTEPSADNNDFILIFDVSAGFYRKQKRADFLAGLSKIRAVTTINTNTTLTPAEDHVRVDSSSAPVVITLPLAASNIGLQYTIKKVDSSTNSVTIQTTGGDTIDGAATLSWNVPYQSWTIIAGAAGQWDIV